ncbi:MAG: competence/damage-inducible protein A [Candidatus Eisenbacteria bacterium]
MRASIITIGDELIGGETVDTNSVYLARRLGELGIGVVRIVSIADDADEISSELMRAVDEADLVFVTGGLGSTADDVTKCAVARATGREPFVDERLLSDLKERFKDHKGVQPYVLENLATLPGGSRPLENPVGAAAGLAVSFRDSTVYLFPGVPREMEAIFEGTVVGELRERRSDEFRKTRLVRTIGISESRIAERLEHMLPLPGISLGSLPRTAGVDLRLTATAGNEAEADSALEAAIEMMTGPLGRQVYSTEGEDLHVVVGRMLIEKRKTIAVAESCTGGLVAHLLTDVAGISASLERGIVSYSNEAKVESLNVDEALIRDHGAVSPEVADAMARCVRRLAGTDIGVSTTGIAGPAGGTEDKPVGLVYTALACDEGCTVSKNVFRGARTVVKQRAAAHVLDMIRCHLLDAEREQWTR